MTGRLIFSAPLIASEKYGVHGNALRLARPVNHRERKASERNANEPKDSSNIYGREDVDQSSGSSSAGIHVWTRAEPAQPTPYKDNGFCHLATSTRERRAEEKAPSAERKRYRLEESRSTI